MQSESFDVLDDAQQIDVRRYAAVLGVSIPTVWRGIKAGTMVPPRRVGSRCTRFCVGEIRAKHGLQRATLR
jgi:predicted DNA-binding transcriptional regulator AlpA